MRTAPIECDLLVRSGTVVTAETTERADVAVSGEVIAAIGPDLGTRAKTVIDVSVQLGQWLLDGERGDVPGLIGRVAALVGEPA
jgi:hypothetical protein